MIIWICTLCTYIAVRCCKESQQDFFRLYRYHGSCAVGGRYWPYEGGADPLYSCEIPELCRQKWLLNVRRMCGKESNELLRNWELVKQSWVTTKCGATYASYRRKLPCSSLFLRSERLTVETLRLTLRRTLKYVYVTVCICACYFLMQASVPKNASTSVLCSVLAALPHSSDHSYPNSCFCLSHVVLYKETSYSLTYIW